MADTTLIIKIPDHLYKLLKELPSDSKESNIENVLMKAVEHGIPLRKGHGRIVDIGPYEGKVIASRKYCGVNKLVEVAELDTIIEADNEVEE